MFAANATLVLGLLATTGLPAALSSQTTRATGGFICPSDAKPANLNFTLKDLNGHDVRLAQFKMNYPVLQGLGRDEVLNAFGPMEGLPTTFVISRDGRICETHTGLSSKSSFETQIKALLPERR